MICAANIYAAQTAKIIKRQNLFKLCKKGFTGNIVLESVKWGGQAAASG